MLSLSKFTSCLKDEWNSESLEKREHFKKRFSVFTREDRTLDETDVQLMITSITRGANLLQNAVNWKEPVIASGSDETLNRIRALQWRHAMAHSGFERLTSGLVGQSQKEQMHHVYERIAQALPKRVSDGILTMPAPKKIEDQLDWRWNEDDQPTGLKLSTYLGINGRHAQKHWGKWVDSPSEILELLTALHVSGELRNATVHGALSPSGVQRTGLKDTLESLPERLCLVSDAALDLLCSEHEH